MLRRWVLVWLSMTLVLAVFLVVGRSLPTSPILTFVRQAQEPADIYLMDVQRALLHNVTHHPESDRAPAWSPDGRRLAFVSDRGGKAQLYVIDVPGYVRDPQPLIAASIAPGYRPVWSPDGRWLLVEISHGSSDLYLVDPDCQPAHQNCDQTLRILVDDPTDDRFPVWSPDQSRIAFITWRTGDAEIYTVTPDGGELRNLSNSREWDVSPSWSPDGHEIAFFSLRDLYRELYVVSVDDGRLRRLTNEINPYSFQNTTPPVWSPDGRYLAYVSMFEGNPNIALIEAHCSGQSDDCSQTRVTISSSAAADINPFWSPDGRSLYFLSNRQGQLAIFRVDLSCLTCPPVRLTDPQFHSLSPVWRP
ncbi:MAG: PD40 domain-containing protein [Anaerolineae bacterium]|nr:PD40 domain-containing protein [Anaerolineae bacterium]